MRRRREEDVAVEIGRGREESLRRPTTRRDDVAAEFRQPLEVGRAAGDHRLADAEDEGIVRSDTRSVETPLEDLVPLLSVLLGEAEVRRFARRARRRDR